MITMTVSEAKGLSTDWGTECPRAIGSKVLSSSLNESGQYQFILGEIVNYMVVLDATTDELGTIHQNLRSESAVLIEG